MTATQRLRKAYEEHLNQTAQQVASETGRTTKEIRTIMEIDHQVQAQLDWLS